MTQDEAPAIDVKLDQAVTDHDDVFIVNNWGPEVTEKNGEPFSFDAVCSEENTVSLTGVKNPRSFTKAELLAMPQTEFTMALPDLRHQRPRRRARGEHPHVTGVPGWPTSWSSAAAWLDGANAVNASGYDGWGSLPAHGPGARALMHRGLPSGRPEVLRSRTSQPG